MSAVLAAAVDWHVRLHDSQVDAATEAAWRRWLEADPSHQAAWQRVQQLQQRLGQGLPPMAARTLENARQQRRHALKLFALLLAAGGLGWQGYQASPWRADLYTGVGERRRERLADGSRLELGTDSRVDLRFDAAERRLQLLQGELLLDTTEDARPFFVVCRDGLVSTEDACFSLRQDAQRSRLIVERGALTLQVASQPPLRLQAGQALHFDRLRMDAPAPAPVDANAWTRGMLRVVDWRLADFLAELGRYRHGHLGCDARVAGLQLSGAFTLDDSEAVLAMLEASLPVQVRRFTRFWVQLEPATKKNTSQV